LILPSAPAASMIPSASAVHWGVLLQEMPNNAKIPAEMERLTAVSTMRTVFSFNGDSASFKIRPPSKG